MNLDDRLTQLLREAVGDMLDERIERLEESVVGRVAVLLERRQEPARPSLLLTQGEVAAQLKASPRTVQRLVSEGRLPAPIKLGANSPRWRAKDIEAFVEGGGA